MSQAHALLSKCHTVSASAGIKGSLDYDSGLLQSLFSFFDPYLHLLHFFLAPVEPSPRRVHLELCRAERSALLSSAALKLWLGTDGSGRCTSRRPNGGPQTVDKAERVGVCLGLCLRV